MVESDAEPDLRDVIRAGHVSAIVGELKSGKEATVHLARGPEGLLVVKRYRPFTGRRVHTDPIYRQGQVFRDREARAFERRTRFGRRLAAETWIAAEFATLRRLGRARGLPVPRVLARVGACVVMEFIADEPGGEGPAPRLIDAPVQSSEARTLHAQIMLAVIGLFERHVVHADLSPYNVLLPAAALPPGGSEFSPRRRPILIDFPQAVDPRKNLAARDLLAHDVAQITAFFRRLDPAVSDNDLAARLWRRFESGLI